MTGPEPAVPPCPAEDDRGGAADRTAEAVPRGHGRTIRLGAGGRLRVTRLDEAGRPVPGSTVTVPGVATVEYG